MQGLINSLPMLLHFRLVWNAEPTIFDVPNPPPAVGLYHHLPSRVISKLPPPPEDKTALANATNLYTRRNKR
jgi:hypothetical protein